MRSGSSKPLPLDTTGCSSWLRNTHTGEGYMGVCICVQWYLFAHSPLSGCANCKVYQFPWPSSERNVMYIYTALHTYITEPEFMLHFHSFSSTVRLPLEPWKQPQLGNPMALLFKESVLTRSRTRITGDYRYCGGIGLQPFYHYGGIGLQLTLQPRELQERDLCEYSFSLQLFPVDSFIGVKNRLTEISISEGGKLMKDTDNMGTGEPVWTYYLSWSFM